MPRYLRDCPWGSVQHVVHRFLNREYLFDDTMRLAYVRRLAKVYAQCDWLFFAYAFLPLLLFRVWRSQRFLFVK